MSRLPVEPSRITPDESGLPEYEWRGTCRIPWCEKPATDPHHVVRRSHTGGPVWWIVVDGRPMPNVLGVCRSCHDQLTFGTLLLFFKGGQWIARTFGATIQRPDEPVILERDVYRSRVKGRCETCGRKWPKPSPYREPTEARAWGEYRIRVPNDHEDGGRILEELLGLAAERQGFDDTGDGTLDYYALVGALHSALTDGELSRPANS